MLGRRYGTRPPDAYYQELARNPDAFRFMRGRAARRRAAAELRAFQRGRVGPPRADVVGAGPDGLAGPAGVGGPSAVGLGPRDEPVVGDIYVPVVLGLFDDSPPSPPVTRAAVQTGYFGPQAGSVADFYSEISNDSITLIGDVQDWVTSSMTQFQSAEGISGLGCCGIGNYIKTLLGQLPAVDWGVYDNDGPDGVPNSGDDDGFVDALAVIHPTAGAECQGNHPNRIWSHKWTLSDASSGTFYETTTVSAQDTVPVIRIEDYFVQGAVSCDGPWLNEIGVFSHELGHAFGLPDLYDTRSFGQPHDGAGSWDLMATGTWGCGGGTPESPCHMGAWSKAALGWVTVDTLPPDTDLGTLTLPPVETGGVVYRVDAQDGSDEYFLLENRQSDVGASYDQSLPSEGLLIWQIDQGVVDATWSSNLVNASNHMGVWLRQADGLDELGLPGGDRGDGGDPFPGTTNNTAFHAASTPSATSFLGTPTGLTLFDITPVVDDIELRVLTRFTAIGLTSSGTAPGTSVFTVNSAPVPAPPANLVSAAPFESLVIEAAPGDSTAPGVRTSFTAWDDDPGEARSRLVVTPLQDTLFNASYAGTEYQLRVDMTGGVNGVDPALLSSTPPSADLWFPPSTAVTLTATVQVGFSFLGWSGGLLGQPNPASVIMDAPVFGGADFELIYAIPDTVVDLIASVPTDLRLAVENGTDPVSWFVESGTAPAGVVVGADGSVMGAPLDLGSHPLVLRATDALGLSGTANVTFDIAAPGIPIARLGDSFFLGGQPLDSLQAAFLDHQGNQSGAYDLGDFRAWVLANPSLPLSTALAPAAPARDGSVGTIMLPVKLVAPESER